jgi:hypothetical protein
MESVV